MPARCQYKGKSTAQLKVINKITMTEIKENKKRMKPMLQHLDVLNRYI